MKTNANLAIVQGTLSSDPRRRELPSGDEVMNYEITTEIDGLRTSVPVAWFSPKRPPAVAQGDAVVAVGFVRRRFFQAGGGAASRTEVVAEVVARPGTRPLGRALAAVQEVLADVLEGG
jgi:single-strand DNA-binding protein